MVVSRIRTLHLIIPFPLMRSLFYSGNECVDMDTSRSLLQAAGKGKDRRMNSLEIYCVQLFQQKMKSLLNKLRKMKTAFSISSMMYNSTTHTRDPQTFPS
jgi:hypothetical protein